MLWPILLVVLLLLCIWGGGYILSVFEIEVATSLQWVATALVVLGAVAWFFYRRYRAQKRARDLEAEILRQSEEQAAMARPDRRAEILELQKRVQSGIQALKNTKVGKSHGAQALYALPWYAIIGPPGAGKTTALKHSGLIFPAQDTGGQGVRGVGGTRNCDWWFTNEGILLDTAGRYATDDADRDEWLAFLGMLRKYRPQKPINGLMVAISVSDLFEATDEQISAYASKLRARVDEIMTRLDMILPVYVIFTKADLIGGFVEFWGDVRKRDRDQILGATFPLNDVVAQAPGQAFAQEFDQLVQVVHARSIKIIGAEPQPDARAKIFQFPLEFQALAANTQQFIDELFRRNSFQENPLFRGFYFTSGTQEGAPFQRIMGNMARALGIRQSPSRERMLEPKSYFVTDVFRRVVFPDQHLAGRTAFELRRQKLIRTGIATAAVLFGILLLVPGLFSMGENRTLISTSESLSKDAASVQWGSGESARTKVAKLDKTHEQLRVLDGYIEEGPPMSLRWGMYQGNTIHPALLDAYAGHLERGMASPSRKQLEQELETIGMLATVPPGQYGRRYDSLKVYIMLTEPQYLDIEWAIPQLTSVWAALLRDGSKETQEAMNVHVRYYLELIQSGAIPAWPAKPQSVARARSVLLRAPVVQRTYDLLVNEANRDVAPITRENIFYGTIRTFVSSKNDLRVEGAYTREGWARVRKLLSTEHSRLSGEKWVLGEKEDLAVEEIEKQVRELRKVYFDRFQMAWRNFIADLVVERPADIATSLDELNALSEMEWPYLRLIRSLHENVTLDINEQEASELESVLGEAAKNAVNKAGNQAKRALGVKPAKGEEEEEVPVRLVSSVEKAFLPMTSFGVPPEGSEISTTKLAQYQMTLGNLVGIMTDLRNSDTPTNTSELERSFEAAFREASTLLATQGPFTKPLLAALLMPPLTGAWSSVSNDVGGAAGGLWELSVWEDWRTQLEPNFPFSPSLKGAKIDDFVEFFAPKSGKLWSFYDQNLKGAVKRSGESYVASRRFDSSVAYHDEFLSNCLARGRKITDAFFTEDATALKIEYQVNLHSVSRNVSQVSIQIDGVEKVYQNTPEEWLSGTWPAEEGEAGARIRIQGDNGLDVEIMRAGEFGFFQLVHAGLPQEGTKAGDPNGTPTLVTSYEFPSEKASLQLDIRTKRGLDVLTPELFAGYTCPRTIASSEN